MISMNMLVGVGVTCLFLGAFVGFMAFALVSVGKQADEQMQQQTEEALFGAPQFDKRA